MTMERKARKIQGFTRETGDVSGRDPSDVMVETGIAVHRKSYAAEREGRGKSRENCRIC
jgi:hypothetical protein